MIRYIVICGAPHSGRSTLARELARHLKSAVTESFDAPIKHFIAAGIGDTFLRMDKNKSRPEFGGHSVNSFTEKLRREFLSDFGPDDVLARWLMHRVLRNPKEKPAFVVVDDCSSQDQIDALPDPITIRIARPGVVECWMRSWSYLVVNDGTLADLWVRAEKIATYLNEGTNENR